MWPGRLLQNGFLSVLRSFEESESPKKQAIAAIMNIRYIHAENDLQMMDVVN